MDPKKPHYPPLLDKTPVLAVTANDSGISILGENSRYSRFQHYDRSLQARIDKQNKPQHERFQAEAGQLVLNPIQRTMYRRVMYGLKEFAPEQIAAMDTVQRERVIRDHEKCNEVLHRLKVDVVYGPYNRLLNACFGQLHEFSKKHPARIESVMDLVTNRRRNVVSESSSELTKEPIVLGTKTADYKVRLPASATLNKLKIGTDKVVAALIEARLLPDDFLTITPGTLVLR